MNNAYILLGTNIGDKINNLSSACNRIATKCGSIKSFSSVYETSPWGITDQPSFLNKVIKIEVAFSATELLELLLGIEKEMGRERNKKWGERLIDLDILYFNNDIISGENIKIPHPEIHNRNFTLIPLLEIAPRLIHPVFNVTTEQLQKRCSDKGSVIKYPTS